MVNGKKNVEYPMSNVEQRMSILEGERAWI